MRQDHMTDRLEPLLIEAADSINQGGDVSPSLRFKIEGEIGRLVACEPDLLESLAREIGNRIPRAVLTMRDAVLQLDIWQERAPVVPSTKG